MLWHKNVLSATAHVFGSTTYNFALDGDVLLVRLANHGGDTSVLFALRASDGGILWHYNMNAHYVLTASHGIVYVGSRDVQGGNPTLRALPSEDGAVLWSYHNNSDPITILVVNKVLYIQANVFYPEPTTHSQSLTTLDAVTGEPIWSRAVIHKDPLAESPSDKGLLLSRSAQQT